MNDVNICPSCKHFNHCVLTEQKDKVWSCSEYEERDFNYKEKGIVKTPKKTKIQELELV